jgi:hypothetical protein
MGCLSCGRGFHQECPIGCSICHSQNQLEIESEPDNDEDWRKGFKRNSRGKGRRDETLRDQQSTGRKRAAKEYPLDRNAACEWQGLLFAGGGTYPIVGCLDGKQQARHHGPDKNTLNNELGNVHRICHQDHNRWHSRNDEGYNWGSVYRSHNGETKASPQEQFDDMKTWIHVKLQKVVD